MRMLPLLCTLCLGLFLGACASAPVPQFRLHTLEYAPPSQDLARVPAILRVAHFGIAPELRTPALVASRPFSRSDIPLERWRALPSELAADFLRRDFTASGVYTAVVEAGAYLPSDFILEGMVEEWSKRQSAHADEARLGITLTLVDARAPLAQAVVFQRRYDEVEPCPSPTGDGMAQAMSAAMARLSARVQADVQAAITKRRGLPGTQQ